MSHPHIFSPRFDIDMITSNECRPDQYTHYSQSKTPNKNFVISRSKSGSILSRYGDPIWDFTPYRTHDAPSQSKIYFSDIPTRLLPDSKWVLFIMLYMAESCRHQRLSVSSIVSYTKTIKNMAKFSNNSNITLIDALDQLLVILFI